MESPGAFSRRGETARSLTPVFSPAIFEEYRRVGELLSTRYGDLGLDPILQLLLAEGILAEDLPLTERVCEDPDDYKFVACALAPKTSVIISGDGHLLDISGYSGLEVLRPRDFADKYMVT